MCDFQKCTCSEELSLSDIGAHNFHSFLPAVLRVHWSSSLNEVSWLQHKNTNYQVSTLEWSPLILLPKAMIAEVNIVEISRVKNCPMMIVGNRESGPTVFKELLCCSSCLWQVSFDKKYPEGHATLSSSFITNLQKWSVCLFL